MLSHPGGGALPEILEHAHHLDLPGLDRARVMDLKLDGTRDEELYRELLLAQCRALHQAMPFLFESVDNAGADAMPAVPAPGERRPLAGTGSPGVWPGR